jgi:transcription antitermination factor NusA-like protein
MAVEIPNDAVGLLIGKSGQTIRLIIDKTGANVQVQKDSEVDRHVSTRIVHVHGFPENVELARNEIMLLVQQHEQQMQQTGGYVADLPGSTEKEMRIPGGIIGYIIGRGGENVKNLQMKYQSRITIEKDDDQHGERHIYLRGLPGNIQALEAEIRDIVESQLDPTSFQRKTLESRSRKAASANPVTSATPYVDPYYNMDAAAQANPLVQGVAPDALALSAQQAAASAAAAASGGDTNLYYEYYQQYYQYYYQQLLTQSYEQQSTNE